jgi:corrinoid protein of di/trimethylamine methyltransferase
MPGNSELLQAVVDAVVEGDSEAAVAASHNALGGGLDPQVVLNEGLMKGADVFGQRFESGEFFLPELMLAGRALKSAMAVVRPELEARYGATGTASGKVVLATVETDIHDIGKNIVGSMLVASGFEVVDLGVDVPITEIVKRAHEAGADIIGLSALLTTSIPYMRDLVELLKARGIRDQYLIIVGGASVTQDYADAIGADGYADNAVQAAQLAQELMRARRAGDAN